MKPIITFFFLAITASLFSQQIDYNLSKGFMAEGYDVVAYFVANKAVEGDKKYQATHNGAKYQFSSEENRALFLQNPEKYTPQYGGYCAYAIAEKKIKMEIDPESYEIRDGKLYLFYNAWFSNKLTTWQEGNTKELQKKGDKNWDEIKYKNK